MPGMADDEVHGRIRGPGNLQRRAKPGYWMSIVSATAHSRSASVRAVEGAIRTRTI